MAKIKIHDIAEIPVKQQGAGWSYKNPSGMWTITFMTKDDMYAHALDYAYDLVKGGVPQDVTVKNTFDYDTFVVNKYSDGTYGFVTSSGAHGEGFKLKMQAKHAAEQLVDVDDDDDDGGGFTSNILKSEDKGGYVVNTFVDGTYGYQMPDGTFKNGYKSKDGAGKAGKKLAKKALDLKKQAEQEQVELLAKGYASKVSGVYGQAVEEMSQKVADFAKAHPDLMDTVKGQQWQGLLEELTGTLTNADQWAMKMANGMLPGVYSDAFNFGTYQVEKAGRVNTAFTLYDRATVENLMAKDPQLLPQAKVDVPKDKAWNMRHVKSAVTQSILQGEPIPKLAKRLQGVAGMSANAAMRNARTMVTGAQNLGRVDAYKRAEAMGVGVRKQWLAALDSRTRGSHRELDGEVVGMDDAFSNGLKYPGDPSGPGYEVYNCRCTLIPVVDGIDYENVERASKLGGMSYDEWKYEKTSEARKEVLALESEYKQLDDAVKAMQAQLVAQDEVFSGIWQDDVTLKDWATKKDGIDKKLEYYDEWIDYYVEAAPAAAEKYKALRARVLEFDEKGKAYKELLDENERLMLKRSALRKRMMERGLIADDPYSEERIAAAWKFESSKDADKEFRGVCGDVWRNASFKDQHAIYAYTSGSGRFNRPLSGYRKPYSAPGTGWEKKYYVGEKKVWIDYEGAGGAVRRMTKLIEKSSYDHDMWLVRGCDYNAMESFFGVPESELESMSTEQLQSLMGTSNRIMSFVSTGTAAGKGFSSKPVAMEIYCPAGSEMMYAEPFSAFSGAHNYDPMEWDGKTAQNHFGQESEMILQRGGSYTVRGIDRRPNGKLHVVLELHTERGYDKFQQDPDEWTGSTDNFMS